MRRNAPSVFGSKTEQGTQPILSVVIPSYNRQKDTERAVESVLGQDVDPEIIVVDDASPIPFEGLSHWKPDRVTVLRHEENRGVSAARNTGIKKARGQFITFLDSDDALLPSTLGRRLQMAQDNLTDSAASKPVVFGCGWRDRRHGQADALTRLPKAAASPDAFYGGCWVSPGSCIVLRKDVFTETVGLFDETMRRLEDVDWFIRFSKAGGTFVVQDLVGVDIWHHESKSSTSISMAADRIVHKHLQSASPRQQRLLRSYLSLEDAAISRRKGHFGKTALHLGRSWLHYPRMRLQTGPGWIMGRQTVE